LDLFIKGEKMISEPNVFELGIAGMLLAAGAYLVDYFKISANEVAFGCSVMFLLYMGYYTFIKP